MGIFRDRIIACVLRRRGNLISTCCGALRQPRSSVSRQPRNTTAAIQNHLYRGYPGHFQPLFSTGVQDDRDPKINFKLQINFWIAVVLYRGWQPRYKTKNRDIPTIIRSRIFPNSRRVISIQRYLCQFQFCFLHLLFLLSIFLYVGISLLRLSYAFIY